MSFDDRFGSAKIAFKSPNSEGVLDAYERPKPVKQKYKVFKNQIDNFEFKNIKALIIGGSRGLGEVATKILCAGGAEVTATYFSGKKESELITKEINSLGDNVNLLDLMQVKKIINIHLEIMTY